MRVEGQDFIVKHTEGALRMPRDFPQDGATVTQRSNVRITRTATGYDIEECTEFTAIKTKDLAMLELELRCLRRQVERLALCSDHRDKATGECVVCRAERRTEENLRMNFDFRRRTNT